MFQMAALFPSPNPHLGAEFSALRMGPGPHILGSLLEVGVGEHIVLHRLPNHDPGPLSLQKTRAILLSNGLLPLSRGLLPDWAAEVSHNETGDRA